MTMRRLGCGAGMLLAIALATTPRADAQAWNECLPQGIKQYKEDEGYDCTSKEFYSFLVCDSMELINSNAETYPPREINASIAMSVNPSDYSTDNLDSYATRFAVRLKQHYDSNAASRAQRLPNQFGQARLILSFCVSNFSAYFSASVITRRAPVRMPWCKTSHAQMGKLQATSQEMIRS